MLVGIFLAQVLMGEITVGGHDGCVILRSEGDGGEEGATIRSDARWKKVLIARGADKDGTMKRGPGYANGLRMAMVSGARWEIRAYLRASEDWLYGHRR